MPNLQSLHELFCEHSLALKGNSPRTIRWLKEIFKYFSTQAGVANASEIDQITVERWLLQGKLEKKWSAKTIRTRMCALGLFFKWLVERNYLESNPIDRIPKPKLPKKLPKSLTKEEALTLLDWSKHLDYTFAFERNRAQAIMGLFIFTGIRKQELLNLKLHDVDLENRTLFVQSGKGEKDRLIPLNAKVLQLLRQYLETRKKRNAQSMSFFISLRYDIPMGEGAVKRLFDKLKERSGIAFSAHPLRHTFATLMLEGGCDIYSLSKMMGHSDIKTTTIYLSATVTQLQRQITKHPLNF